MRVRARIPTVEPTVKQTPTECPYKKCQGRYFKVHQDGCCKPLRDTQLEQVTVQRWKCLKCGRTHRVYPQGVSKAHQSDRLKGLSILFYVLGISYRGVEDVLEALGYALDHTTVYLNVQAAGKRVRQLRQIWLQQKGKVAVVGGDLTYLRCQGERVAIAIAVDDQTGVTLDVEIVDNEESETLAAWLEPLLDLVGAEVLLTDDQDGFKKVADKAGVSHQICRQHVTRNVLDFVAQTARRVLSKPPRVPPDLDTTTDQLLEDLALLEWIMLGHPGNATQYLAKLYDRYCKAPPPKKGQRATPWYRMRNHVLHLWNHWQRYTCYRKRDPDKPIEVNETNNGTERVIGWGIKERYRTMRGYKRNESVKNVAHLTTWLQEASGKRDMKPLFEA